jgi:ApbE superfamily uncharacterized protein (UPF0280 family)
VFAVATARASPANVRRTSTSSADAGNSGSFGRRDMSALMASHVSPNAAAALALLRADTVLSDSDDDGGVLSLTECPPDVDA